MGALIPGHGFRSLRNEVDRIFDRFWEGDPERHLSDWNPPMDLSETKDSYVMKMEIPGMDPKDVKVMLQDQVLMVSGERKYESEKKEEERFHHMERAHGSFFRSVRLPVPVQENNVDAVFTHGLLTVTIPKAEVSKGVTVPVKTA